ncbi:MAG: riboflavin synthase [Thermoflexibacteraceae bacterium]|jgi:riboflavin synthase
MFTGIIETFATVTAIRQEQSNVIFEFESPISQELKIDQSVAHNGVCLTVTAVNGNRHTVTAIDETLQRTNLGKLVVGSRVNLERCLRADGRFDGHFVQGHVDQTAECTEVTDLGGSWRYVFQYDATKGNFTVEKGSICVNGVSLTVVDSPKGSFSVAIIPYTYEHTNFKTLQVGDTINLEFDVLGKYIKKIMDLYMPTK